MDAVQKHLKRAELTQDVEAASQSSGLKSETWQVRLGSVAAFQKRETVSDRVDWIRRTIQARSRKTRQIWLIFIRTHHLMPFVCAAFYCEAPM